jgi:hypothetical protein
VIVMLLALGLRALRSAFRSPQHRHGSGRGHGHGHDQPHEDEALRSHAHARQRRRFGGRSVTYGIIHGLAGSGALTAWVIADLPSLGSRVWYIALFGLGSMMGMAALSGLAGLPLSRLTVAGRTTRVIAGLTGTFSIVLGLRFAEPLLRSLF